MSSKEIQETTDAILLQNRLAQPDVRKKERRLLKRQIQRLSQSN